MGLEDLANVGVLEKLPASWTEVNGLLKKAGRKLSDAKSDSISRETRLEQAYNVILTCALIALRVAGYRILSKKSGHYTAIETLRYTIGLDNDKIDYFQSLRGLRHRDIYEADLVINEEDLSDSIREAESLLSGLETWIAKNFKP